MEEGSLRCDANVSVRPRGQKEFGTKTEVKNVNSFRFVQAALDYEIARQVEVIESGGKIVQETRLYNATGRTRRCAARSRRTTTATSPSRTCCPLVVDRKWRDAIRSRLPELPEARRARMMTDYGLTEGDAHTLTLTKAMADAFESAAHKAKNPKRLANIISQTELIGRLKAAGLELDESPSWNRGGRTGSPPTSPKPAPSAAKC